jgi:hypothetical protein
MSKAKKIPEFKSEAEERAFWETHDSSGYADILHDLHAISRFLTNILLVRMK